MSRSGERRPGRPRAVILGVLYWLAVVVISLAILVGLILFFEARDSSQLEEEGAAPGAAPVSRGSPPCLHYDPGSGRKVRLSARSGCGPGRAARRT